MKIKNSLNLVCGIIFSVNFLILILAAFNNFIEYNSAFLLFIYYQQFSIDISSLIIYFGLIIVRPFYYSYCGFFLIFGLTFYIPSTILFTFSGFSEKMAFIKTGFKIGICAQALNIFRGGLGLWIFIQNAGNMVQTINILSPLLILSVSIINLSLQALLFSDKEETVSLVNLSIEKLTDILQFCPNCGGSLTKLDKFCSRCGWDISHKRKMSIKGK